MYKLPIYLQTIIYEYANNKPFLEELWAYDMCHFEWVVNEVNEQIKTAYGRPLRTFEEYKIDVLIEISIENDLVPSFKDFYFNIIIPLLKLSKYKRYDWDNLHCYLEPR